METDAQEKVLSKFNYSLKQDGILFLGTSESIGDFLDSFSVVDSKWKIFKNIKSNNLTYQFVKNHPIYHDRSSAYLDSQFDVKDYKPEKVDFNITTLAEKNLINLYAPPSALISDTGDILYVHGRLGKYIEPNQGKATYMNILDMATMGIKLGLSSAIQNAVLCQIKK